MGVIRHCRWVRLPRTKGQNSGFGPTAAPSQDPELVAAIRTGAQARVNQIKAQLSTQVADTVTHQLNRSFSFYDSWVDPLIGFEGDLI